MKKPTVITAGGVKGTSSNSSSSSSITSTNSNNHTTTTATIINSLSSASSSKFASDDEEVTSTTQRRNKSYSQQLENRPPNFLPDDDDDIDGGNNHDDDDISYQDEDMEQQMLLTPSGLTKSNDETVSDDDEKLIAQLDDLYHRGEDGQKPTSGGDNVDGDHEVYNEEMSQRSKIIWTIICFSGIMFSFVAYGLLLEYATSGGRKLHELSFLFVTSLLYTVTGAAGRHVRSEKPSTMPPARFAVLGLTSMGSTFCSVRSLRYVIFPIQVLAKSCKPVPVMIMGALMGKKYPLRKYFNVCLVVFGVGLFMSGGSSHKKQSVTNEDEEPISDSMRYFGIILLFISLCFDGGTGAYEDKLMSVYHVEPFDLMYNIQLGKTIIAGVGLVVLNQVHVFLQMCQEMGFVLVALGLTGAMGQAFIFVTISKFGALTCSIIGLSRKVTTLVASIYIYGHALNAVQASGLVISVTAMAMNFIGKKGKSNGHGGGGEKVHRHEGDTKQDLPTVHYRDSRAEDVGDVELPTKGVQTLTAGGRR